ncbi:hypothetical protein D9M68_627870 [compost metagenome]
MKRFFAAVIIGILFYACKPGVPEHIIQPDKMEKVLYDIHITDGYIGTITQPDSAKQVAAGYYKGIYKKFAIDSALYNQSLNYYYNHPDALSAIYLNVMKALEKSRVKNDERVELENRRKQKLAIVDERLPLRVDSLKKAAEFSLGENPFIIYP